MNNIYTVSDVEMIQTPQLVYYKDIILENTKKLITLCGGAKRLFPHVKSHKMAQIVKMQMDLGIDKFKCATLAEAKMVASLSPRMILVAYPMIGRNAQLFIELMRTYSGVRFLTIVDDLDSAIVLGSLAQATGLVVEVLIDINTGLDRTGVSYDEAVPFSIDVNKVKGLKVCGLHVYDGNVHMSSPKERMDAVQEIDTKVSLIKKSLIDKGMDMSVVVAGGSGSTPCHIVLSDFYVSPGTSFVNDSGYFMIYQDLPYIPAGIIMSRVISRPKHGFFTLDCGYKAIGAEMKDSPGKIVGMDNVRSVFQNEEHWVWKMNEGYEDAVPKIGTVLYIIPTHICPTTNLYPNALIAENGKIVDRWDVVARLREV